MQIDTEDPMFAWTAEKYERECFDYARSNPHVAVSMLVEVYSHERAFLGFGIVKSLKWSEFYYEHIVHVEMAGGHVECFPAGCLDRAAFCRQAMKEFLYAVKS